MGGVFHYGKDKEYVRFTHKGRQVKGRFYRKGGAYTFVNSKNRELSSLKHTKIKWAEQKKYFNASAM
jgi:hypothetical protein